MISFFTRHPGLWYVRRFSKMQYHVVVCKASQSMQHNVVVHNASQGMLLHYVVVLKASLL
jgi:hypothetical protein